MNLQFEIPDAVAERVSAATGGNLASRALEAWAAEEYKRGNLYKPDLRLIFGFETSDQIDTFLKAHEVWIEYTMEDLDKELADLKSSRL